MTDGFGNEIQPRRQSVRNGLIVGLIAFIAGGALVAWAVTRWEPARKLVMPAAPAAQKVAELPAPPVTVLPAAPPSAAIDPAQAAAQTAAAEARVAGLEERLARVDTQANAAAGNAARAESMLIAFAARRAIDRGAGLGYIEAQLRDRFGESQPRAVAAIITAGQTPVTLDMLRQGLVTLSPQLAGGGANEDWWSATQRVVGSLFVVRRADAPAATPDERLTRARMQIEGGQVDTALAEIARLPGRDKANAWMAAAKRYVEAHRALDILEAAALTAPKPVPVAAEPAAPPAVQSPSPAPAANQPQIGAGV